jgi:DNA-directed RNA polymerase subunit RPC12/RpoP
MEKRYKCVGCSKDFRVLHKRDNPVYRQHEVEMNVECPYCSKTNAIVWPQDESLPLVVPIDGEKSDVRSAARDFYVQAQCWIKQPQTSDELDRAIKLIHSQELGCHRYSGADPAILRRLPAEDCDRTRPDLS